MVADPVHDRGRGGEMAECSAVEETHDFLVSSHLYRFMIQSRGRKQHVHMFHQVIPND
jgi:hypothetical protein